MIARSPQPQLTAVVAARQQWEAAGVPASRLARVTFVIAMLPLGEVGYTVGDTVYIDPTAAGWGWNTSLALPSANQMDLLTVVLHEIGHTLGLPDGCACGPVTTLMQMTLPAGVRRLLPPGALAPALPAVRRAHRARPHHVARHARRRGALLRRSPRLTASGRGLWAIVWPMY